VNYEVVVLPAAQADLVRLEAFLIEQAPSAARRAVEAISTALRSLKSFPERGRRPFDDGRREVIVPFASAAYVIQYRVGPERVVVIRIFHSREARI
jgi:toxin ParE1/3/4